MAALSLAVPPALQSGATGSFWNPVAVGERRGISVGAHVMHTSDILGLSGLLVGGSLPLRRPLRVGIVLGRMQVRDLVRTTTSPDTEEGSIPVYAQLAGIGIGVGGRTASVGAMVRYHTARLDTQEERGATIDVGVRLIPIARLTVAAASHFFPATFTSDPTTEYYAGAEYAVVERGAGQPSSVRISVRYGATYHDSGDLDHTAGVGLNAGDWARIDAALTSESSYDAHELRPGIGLSLRFGRYVVALAHGLGLNGVGGTYRVGLDVELGR